MTTAYQHDYAIRFTTESGIFTESGISFEEAMDKADAAAQRFYDSNYRYDRNVHTYFDRNPQSDKYRKIEIINPSGHIYNA